MRLLLSSTSPLNVTLSDAETGQVLYKVSTTNWVSTISRVVPSSTEEVMQDRFEEIGQVEHKTFSPSVIKFQGREPVTSKAFFKSEGAWWKGSYKVWTALDGETYAWKMGMSRAMLCRKEDDTKVPVVVYHPPQFNRLSSKPPESAALEISPECRAVLDEIVVTYVYIEKEKNEEERRSLKYCG